MLGIGPHFRTGTSAKKISAQPLLNTYSTAVLFLLLATNVFAQTTLDGTLHAIWGDPHPNRGNQPIQILTLTEDDGRITELQVSPELLSAAGGFYAWNGKRVRVKLRAPGTELPFETAPDARQAASLTLLGEGDPGEGTESITLTGSHPWVSILCKFADIAAEPENLAYFDGMYANQPGRLDDYWREVSYDNIDIVGSTAVDWVSLPLDQTDYVPTPGGGSNADLGSLFDDCTDAADPFVDFSNGGNPFSGINMMFNADLDCCAWGGSRFASLDGISKVWRTTWNPPWAYANTSVIAHEMGHGFGLPHANNWDQDNNPYDSPWDVMSSASSGYNVTDPTYGRLGQHINAHHKIQLDWVSGSSLLQVNDGEVVTATIDASAIQGSPNYSAAQLPIPGSSHYYTVEVRKRIGNYDGNLPGTAVIIHYVVPGRSEPSWSYDADIPPANYADNEGTMFRVGETLFDDDENIEITVDSETANGFVVTIDRREIVAPLDFTSSFE